jgi:hypothetical protein
LKNSFLCHSTTALLFLYQQTLKQGLFEFYSSFQGMNVRDGVESIDMCIVNRDDFKMVYIIDRDGTLSPKKNSTQGPSTLVASDNRELLTFANTTKCTDVIKGCYQYCAETCFRSMRYSVTGNGQESYQLKVCRRDDRSKCALFGGGRRGTIGPHTYIAHLPAGFQYDAVFLDGSGQQITATTVLGELEPSFCPTGIVFDVTLFGRLPTSAPISLQLPPIAAPVVSPILVPAMPVTNPIVAPVKTPVAFPVPFPMSVPIEVPATTPVAIPVTIPVAIPVGVPTSVPITVPIIPPGDTPVAIDVPISNPVAAPIENPVTEPIAAPVGNPASVPVNLPMVVPSASPITAVGQVISISVPLASPTVAPANIAAAFPAYTPIIEPVSSPFLSLLNVPVDIPVAIPLSTPVVSPIAAPSNNRLA